jgi:hypothetical protein
VKIWRKGTLAALFLFCTMFFALSMTAAAAESGKWDDNLSWELDDKGTLTITALHGKGGNDQYNFIIFEDPAEAEYGLLTLADIPLEKVQALILNGPVDVYWGHPGIIYQPDFAPFDLAYNPKVGCGYHFDAETFTLTYFGDGTAPYIGAIEAIMSKPNNPAKIIISDGSINIEKLPETDYLILGKDAKFIDLGASYGMPVKVNKELQIDPQNPYYSYYEGGLYSKDYTRFFGMLDEDSETMHPNTKIISQNAVLPTGVIPWGVTTLEGGVIRPFGTYVIPDTCVNIDDTASTDYHLMGRTIIFSSKNEAAKGAFKNSHLGYIVPERYAYVKILDSLKEYYPEQYPDTVTGWLQQSNGWVYYNQSGEMVKSSWAKDAGKWYYLGSDGLMAANRWVQDGSKWYYVRKDGIMLANTWIKSANKWYYLKADGAMAAGQWVYASDKKWYYLDGSGVMLTNTTTPDGCGVDEYGVWVR